MTYPSKHLIDSYASLFESLSALNKLELIERLSKSLQREKTDKEAEFYSSFGAFASTKSAEEISADIKASRKFRKKDISF